MILDEFIDNVILFKIVMYLSISLSFKALLPICNLEKSFALHIRPVNETLAYNRARNENEYFTNNNI